MLKIKLCKIGDVFIYHELYLLQSPYFVITSYSIHYTKLYDFNIHPTIIVNETEKNILKKTIDYYKTTTNNAHIYDFTRSSDSKHHKLYLGPTSQVALTSSLRGKLAGARITSYNVCYTKLLRTYPAVRTSNCKSHGR